MPKQHSPVPLRLTAAFASTLALVTATALPSIAHAQRPPASVIERAPTTATEWDEARVVARASERTPTVQTARALVDAARAQEAFGRVPVIGNPLVSLRAMVGVPDESAATYALAVGIPFDVSSRRSLAMREAARAIEQAEAELAVALNDARAEARAAWADVSVSNDAIETANARTDTARQLLERTRTRLQAQSSTALDVTLAERELAEAEAEVASARRAREEAVARFREALDLPPLSEVLVAPLRPPAMPSGMSREEAVHRAAQNRREATAFAASAARLRTSADRQRAAALAPLTIAGELEVQGNQTRATTVGVSANWALPLAATAQGERAVANAEALAADTRRELATRAAGREASSAWAQLVSHLEEYEAVDRRVVPAAQRALDQTEALFQAGAVDSFRVLLARRDLYAARARRTSVAREAWRARIALDRAMGVAAR